MLHNLILTRDYLSWTDFFSLVLKLFLSLLSSKWNQSKRKITHPKMLVIFFVFSMSPSPNHVFYKGPGYAKIFIKYFLWILAQPPWNVYDLLLSISRINFLSKTLVQLKKYNKQFIQAIISNCGASGSLPFLLISLDIPPLLLTPTPPLPPVSSL